MICPGAWCYGFPSLLGGDCLAFVPRVNGDPRGKLVGLDGRAKGREARVSSAVQAFNDRAETKAPPPAQLSLPP